MERKGFLPAAVILPIAIAIVIVIVGLVAGFKVLFTRTYLFYGIGITILVLSLIYGLNAQSLTKPKQKFLGILVFIGLLFILLPAFGIVENTAVSGTYIQVPLKGFYSCEPASQKVPGAFVSIGATGSGNVRCPSNSDTCDFDIKAPKPSLWSNVFGEYRLTYQVCDISGGFCQQQQTISGDRWGVAGDTITTRYAGLLNSQQIVFHYQKATNSLIGTKWNDITGSSYRVSYAPYIIWKTSPTEGKTEYSSVTQGCSFTINDAKNLIISDTLGYGAGSSNDLNNLAPGKTRNFINIFVPVSIENAKIQNDGQAYCSNNKLYPIDTVTLISGTYKTVNTYEVIKAVECCNGDVEPGIRQCQNNKWVALPKPGVNPTPGQEIQCSAFKPCSGSDWTPYTTTSLTRSVCENSVCVQKSMEVECTDNSKCGVGNTCDTKTYKCVAVPNATVVANNTSNLEQQCSLLAQSNSLAGYTWVTEVTEPSVWKKIYTFGTAKSVTTGYCKAQYIPYYVFSAIILVVSIIFYSTFKTKRRRR